MSEFLCSPTLMICNTSTRVRRRNLKAYFGVTTLKVSKNFLLFKMPLSVFGQCCQVWRFSPRFEEFTLVMGNFSSDLEKFVSNLNFKRNKFIHIWGISRIRRNLSIHIARFSASESLRVYPNIYKNSPPFASSKGFPQVGFAMRVRERESASYIIILSLLALRADVSILARALFYLFLPFILISH